MMKCSHHLKQDGTMTIRNHRYSLVAGAVAALFAIFAACVNTQPLSAQTSRDSAIAKAAATAKAVTDTMALLPAPNLAQYCRAGAIGYMKNGACLTFPRLLRR